MPLNNPAPEFIENWKFILKTADQTVNNSEVLVNDTHLVFPVKANEIWHILFNMLATRAGNQDIDLKFAVPAGGTITGIHEGDVGGMTAGGDPPLPHDYASEVIHYIRQTNSGKMLVWLTYVGGGAAGNVQLQWAQSTAEANDTKMLTYSFLLAHKVH